MSNEYAIEVRREARRLWLSGRYTDVEVAVTGRIRTSQVRSLHNQPPELR